MKVHTNAGAVELTADMVRPGMVFWGANYHMADGKRFTAGRWDAADQCWRDANRDSLATDVASSADRLLGCDPAIAAREDVERYGVAPDIDAGAHGFARLQDGGAVDMRRQENFCSQFVYATADGERRTRKWADLGEDERFVGLDVRRARREDVLRLCCLDANRSASGPGGERCTLAIGDHDTHEDLATGVRWHQVER